MAFLAQLFGEPCPAFLFLVGTHVDYLDVGEIYLQALSESFQSVGVAQQHWLADAFLSGLYGCLHHVGVSAFGKDHFLRMHSRRVMQVSGKLGFLTEHLHEPVFVFLPVGYLFSCHTTVDGCLCHSHAHLCNQSRVDGFWNEVFRSEGEVVDMIDIVHHIGHRLLGKIGNGINSSHFHLFVDGSGVDIERSPEDIRKSDDVVNLVGIVGTSSCHDHIGTAFDGVFVANLGNGVCQSKDDGRFCHRPDHVFRQDVAFRQSHKHIGSAYGFFKCVDVGACGSEHLFLLVQVGTIFCDDSLRVDHHHILELCTEGEIEFRTANGGSTCSVHNDFYLIDFLLCHLKRILQSGCRDDGSTVLVVVHHWNVESLLQSVLYIETLRCLDILKIDASEGRSYSLNGFTELHRVFLVHFYVEDIDATIDFKQQTFTLHDRLAAYCSYVTKTEHSSTV